MRVDLPLFPVGTVMWMAPSMFSDSAVTGGLPLNISLILRGIDHSTFPTMKFIERTVMKEMDFRFAASGINCLN